MDAKGIDTDGIPMGNVKGKHLSYRVKVKDPGGDTSYNVIIIGHQTNKGTFSEVGLALTKVRKTAEGNFVVIVEPPEGATADTLYLDATAYMGRPEEPESVRCWLEGVMVIVNVQKDYNVVP